MPPKKSHKKRASKGASAMLASIAGDMNGGPFEFRKYNVFSEAEVTLFDKERYLKTDHYKAGSPHLKYEFTDDTVLSVAVARSLMQSRGMGREQRVKVIANNLKKFYNLYPVVPWAYGNAFQKWAAK